MSQKRGKEQVIRGALTLNCDFLHENQDRQGRHFPGLVLSCLFCLHRLQVWYRQWQVSHFGKLQPEKEAGCNHPY